MPALSPSPELEAIARRWLHAYSVGDKDTVINLLSDDPLLSYVGSAPDEVLRDKVMRRGFASMMDTTPKFEWVVVECHSVASESIGWVELHLDTSVAATGMSVRHRAVMIFHLEKGVWKIVHGHTSTPVPNMQALGYEIDRFDDLIEATQATDFAQTGIATIMFTDIADSTTIAETIGDARWSRAVNAHVRAVQGIIEDHGGTLVKSLGDGTMSSFPSARAALSCAIALQRAMGDDISEPHLMIRIGLHTGDLIEQDGDMFGTVVNKAARIAAIANPGDIRLSDATRIMVGSGEFTFADPIATPIKGLEGEHTLHRLDWRA